MGKIQRLLGLLETALTAQGVRLDPIRLERTAVSIYESMGAPQRKFHTLDHVFSFDFTDSVEALAALFHDVVYYGVDKCWPSPFEKVLSSVAGSGMPGTGLAKKSTIPFYSDVLCLFGTSPGDNLPVPGTNELTSALAFSSSLGDVLSRETVLAVSACIEATIAFRGRGSIGHLHERIMSLGIDSEKADEWVCRAVRMAGRDVSDFHHEDTAFFLAGTWKLLPELNPELGISEHFTITTYRKAIAGMEGFFSSLSPERIFDVWKGEPGPEVLAHWTERARDNLSVAKEYLGAKLLAAALLEAFAAVTGPDALLPLFMGSAGGGDEQRLEDFLPPGPEPFRRDKVFELLEQGRLSEASFDLKNSPLAAFIFRHLDQSLFEAEVARAKQFFAGKVDAQSYLTDWSPAVRKPIAQALWQFVPTRRQGLDAWR